MKELLVSTANIFEVQNIVKEFIKHKLFHDFEENMEIVVEKPDSNKKFFERSNCFFDERSAEEFQLIDDKPGIIEIGVLGENGPYEIHPGDKVFHDEEWIFIQKNGFGKRLIALKKGALVTPKNKEESAFEL